MFVGADASRIILGNDIFHIPVPIPDSLSLFMHLYDKPLSSGIQDIFFIDEVPIADAWNC